ncbi:MAG: 23S rRNA (guanosine(2251)-2'-O)-methyltransferase RlmB, partial [Clostridia bacterium]
GDRKPYGDKPAYGEKKPYGDRKPYGDKPAYGEKKPYGESKPYGDKPAYGEKKSYGERNQSYERDTRPQEPELSAVQQGDSDELPFLIIGRNAVREAIKTGRSIDRILVQTEQDGSLREIVSLARDHKLVLRETDRKKLDELCLPFGHGGKTANHQGIVAYAAGVEYCEVSDILALAKEKGEDAFVIVLDGIMDPHNLGSIIRSAHCAGAHGVIIGKRRSASVTAATVKAASGATEHIKIARATNIVAAIEQLKKAGLWIAGADMDGRSMNQQGLNGPLALVIGNEGVGLGKLVSEACDFLVSIPMHGQISSLNAAVAAGILMFEKKRQDAGVPKETV